MKTEERIKKQKELVEEIGRYFDREGFQPIAGRILALLMVMDKEQFTFDEIIEELQISKSSASNALKNLEIRGNIEYKTLPGDRKRYFHIKRQNALSIVQDFEMKMLTLKEVIVRIIELKADKTSENTKLYREVIAMMEYTLDMINKTKQKFSKK